MKKGFVLILVLIIAGGVTGVVNAAEEIEAQVRTEVTVSLRLVDEERKPLPGEKKVMVEVSRGGLKDPGIFSSGLLVQDGVGRFVYITPATPGPAEVRIIEPETGNLLKKVPFIITEPASVSSKEEIVLVAKVTGRVEVYPDGRWLRGGEELAAGVTVITDEDSWLNLKFFHSWQVVVQPVSTLRLTTVKSSALTGKKECRLELVSGKIYVMAQEYSEEDLFQVQAAGAAVYAYAREAVFEVIVSDTGMETIAYRGQTLLEDVSNGLLFPVVQGQKIILPPEGGVMPGYYSHRTTPEMREDALPVAEFLLKDEPEKPPAAREQTIPETQKAGLPGFTYRTGASLTTGTFGDYVVLSLQPQFLNIYDTAFSFGLDLPLTFNQTTGEVRFGAVHPGIKVDNLVDWIKFAGKNFHLHYGIQEELTYGHGLLFGDYTSGYRKTRFGLRNIFGGCLDLDILCPWEIRSFYPWAVEDNFSLYAGRIGAGFDIGGLRLQAGFTSILDSGFNKRFTDLWFTEFTPGIATQGMAVDAGISWTEAFQPFIEWATLGDFGSGLEAGVQGQAGFLRYKAAYLYMGEGFYPNYFGGEYDSYTLNTLDLNELGLLGTLPDLKAPCYAEKSHGYLLGLGILTGDILSLDVSFTNCNREDGYFPIFTGNLDLSLPALGPVPPVSTGFNYRRYRLTEFALDSFLEENISFSYYVELMLREGAYATLTHTYCPFSPDISYDRKLSLELKF